MTSNQKSLSLSITETEADHFDPMEASCACAYWGIGFEKV